MQKDPQQTNTVTKIKNKTEPFVWLITTSLPVLSFLGVAAWHYVGEPSLSSYVKSIVESDYEDTKKQLSILSTKISQIEQSNNSTKGILLGEVGSAYFISKSYDVGDASKEQDPLQGFFYSLPSDQVSLSIFMTEHHPDLFVSLNGATPISLRDVAVHQQRNTWSDIDIDTYIAKTPLTDQIYIDLPPNVHNISITPNPRRMKAGDRFDLYALVIVRHSK